MLYSANKPKLSVASSSKKISSASKAHKAPSGHSKALPVHNIDFNSPGRLRVGHLLTLFSVSHSGLYAHLGTRYPLPDGKDGGRPYWNIRTVRDFLEGA